MKASAKPHVTYFKGHFICWRPASFDVSDSKEEKLLSFVLYTVRPRYTENADHLSISKTYLKVKEIVCADSFQPALKTRFVRSQEKEFAPESLRMRMIFLILNILATVRDPNTCYTYYKELFI